MSLELSAGQQIDRYRVEGVLGRGGMAMVYKVRHVQLGTLHALKLLLVPSPAIRQRLLTEGRVQGRLRHPNIVPVTDVVDVSGAPGLVMEYIDGASLDRLLAKQRLSLAQADHIARGILAGVAAAHDHGLVHRDLKPANVMLQLVGGSLLPKVTDFGLAKILDDDGGAGQTRSGVAMGTPAYMAPEQVRDSKSVDARADVYSLGAILYELVCGERVFPGDDTLEIFGKIRTGEFVPPRQLAPDLPDRMERAILGALRGDRDDRIADVHALSAMWCDDSAQGSELFDGSVLAAVAGLGGGKDEARIGSAPDAEAPSASDTFDPLAADSLTLDLPGDEAGATFDGFDEPAPDLVPPPPESVPEPSSPEPVQEEPEGERGVWLAGGAALASAGAGVGIMVLGVVVAGLLAASGMMGGGPAEVPAAVAPAPVAAPSAAPAPQPVQQAKAKRKAKDEPKHDKKAKRSRRPAPTPEPAVATPPAPEPAAEPEPVVPAPAPAAAPTPTGPPSGMGRVVIVGDRERVFLLPENSPVAVQPGDVQPGSYTVQIGYDSGAVQAGKLQVAAGQTVRMRCNRAQTMCRKTR